MIPAIVFGIKREPQSNKPTPHQNEGLKSELKGLWQLWQSRWTVIMPTFYALTCFYTFFSLFRGYFVVYFASLHGSPHLVGWMLGLNAAALIIIQPLITKAMLKAPMLRVYLLGLMLMSVTMFIWALPSVIMIAAGVLIFSLAEIFLYNRGEADLGNISQRHFGTIVGISRLFWAISGAGSVTLGGFLFQMLQGIDRLYLFWVLFGIMGLFLLLPITGMHAIQRRTKQPVIMQTTADAN